MEFSKTPLFRLGDSPLKMDLRGLAPLMQNPTPDKALKEAWEALKSRLNRDDAAFFDAPSDITVSDAPASVALAKKLLAKNIYNDCLFLGIGGSALGPLSVITALSEKRKNAVRFHFIENVDPVDWKATLDRLNPKETLVCVVTKSGTTFETLAQFLCAAEWLQEANLTLQEHVVAITDPKKGDLRQWASDNHIETLPIHPAVGGRFSVFTPVGLFALALAGLDVEAFLKGALEIRDYIDATVATDQPLFRFGAQLVDAFPNYSTHVFMPYSTKLKRVGDWFVQLWGESLGKSLKGFTPMSGVGATDQHSLLQLLRDGPNDKVTFLVRIAQMPEVNIPAMRDSKKSYPAFDLVSGSDLGTLLGIECDAVVKVMTNQRRAFLILELDSLNERSLGALLFSLCVLTAFTGVYWKVNPFDQPGVEEGKVYIRDALKKP